MRDSPISNSIPLSETVLISVEMLYRCAMDRGVEYLLSDEGWKRLSKEGREEERSL
jgi:hypothetical protein